MGSREAVSPRVAPVDTRARLLDRRSGRSGEIDPAKQTHPYKVAHRWLCFSLTGQPVTCPLRLTVSIRDQARPGGAPAGFDGAVVLLLLCRNTEGVATSPPDPGLFVRLGWVVVVICGTADDPESTVASADDVLDDVLVVLR